jgi:hypothetical protein
VVRKPCVRCGKTSSDPLELMIRYSVVTACSRECKDALRREAELIQKSYESTCIQEQWRLEQAFEQALKNRDDAFAALIRGPQ